MIVP
ncbi:hypothetical protein D043_2757A, partial [Vibrio parahaemolyticus EKP-021]|jgi:protein SHQ1